MAIMMRLFKRKSRKRNQKDVAPAPSTGAQVVVPEPKEAPLKMILPPVAQSAPFRTSFFQSASDVGISGGQFNSTRGHHTNLTINFNQGGIEPVLEVDQGVGSSMQPIMEDRPGNALGIDLPKEDPGTGQVLTVAKPSTPPMPLLKPPSPPIQKSSDIYYRHLSVKELGYPLWIPEPNNRLPIKYQRRGIQIGDVGIITPSGSFDFLFNICAPATDPINPRELPEHFAPLHPPLESIDLRGHLEFKPNSYLASASIERSQREENGDIRNFAFESSASEGAILTMPDGAYAEELANVARFRKYLAANAEDWYRYVNGVRGREALNGDVRLVTGCHKTTTWGMATFSDLRERKDFRLQFKPTGEDSRVGKTYRWEYSGMAEVRAGPDPQEIEDLRMAEESETGVIYRNQCLFIRTLNITLRDDIWKQLISELELGFDLDNSQPEDFDATRPQSPSSNNNNAGAAKGKGPTYQPHTANSIATNTFENDVHIPGLKRVLTQHPSKAINEMLLAEYPKAKMAITEDWDWMSLIREDDTTLPTPETFGARARACFNMNHDAVDGVASLQSRNYVSKFFGDSVTFLSDSPAPTTNPSPSHHSLSLSGSTLDGGNNASPSSRSITLSGTTLDSGDETDVEGQEALRSLGMNRSQKLRAFHVYQPLPSVHSRNTKDLPKRTAQFRGISPLLPASLDEIEPKNHNDVVESLPLGLQVKNEEDKPDQQERRSRRVPRKVLFRKSKMDKMRKTRSPGVDYLGSSLDKELGDHGPLGLMGMLPEDDDVGDVAVSSRSRRRRWEEEDALERDLGALSVGRRAMAKIVSLIQ